MQKEDLMYPNVEFTTPEEMAQTFNVSKDFIVKLCIHDLLVANRDENGWSIIKDQMLPCVLEFKDASDDINYKLLRGECDLSFLDLGYSWTERLLDNNKYVEFQNICVDVMIFESDKGEFHLKYAIVAEQFLKVTSWENNFEQFIDDVKLALPNTSSIIGVFDTNLKAFEYARKMFDEINLMDKVKLKYLCNNHLIPDDTIKLLKK